MEEETHPEVITIDDDDEDHVKPLKVHKDKLKTKASSKDVIVYIPNDEVSESCIERCHAQDSYYCIQSREEDQRKKKLNAQRFGESNQCGCDRKWKD